MTLTIGHDGGGQYSLNTGKVKNLILEQAADKPTVRLLDEEWSPAACQSSKCKTNDVIETKNFPCPANPVCSLITNADGVENIAIISVPQPEICNEDESVYPIYPPEVACSDTCCTTPQKTIEITECVDPCIHENIYTTQCILPDFTTDMCVVGEVLQPGMYFFQCEPPIIQIHLDVYGDYDCCHRNICVCDPSTCPATPDLNCAIGAVHSIEGMISLKLK